LDWVGFSDVNSGPEVMNSSTLFKEKVLEKIIIDVTSFFLKEAQKRKIIN
jgi:hypothetical protein